MDDPRDPDPLALALARRQPARHRLRRAVLWVLGVLVVLVLAAAGIGVAAVALFLHDPSMFVSCDLAGERPRALGQNSFLYARDGSRLGAVPSPRNRRPIPLARMGKWLPVATVAIEDRRFWQRRSALDPPAIVRALIADVPAR